MRGGDVVGDRDPEKPSVVAPTPPPPPALVYSAAGTKLVGAGADCAIYLAKFMDGDAVHVMPACSHGFHARCIKCWLAGGRRSSYPTCRAPACTGGPATHPAEAVAAAASSS